MKVAHAFPDAGTHPGHRLAALAMLFFCSGLSSLVYQMLWLRILSLVFGVTVYAAATVLAGFMAGLAIGSMLGGRIGDRLRSPLLGFAVVEIFIAITALATPLGFDTVQTVYARLHDAMPDNLAVLTAARFLCSFAVLIVPTVLMGATSPLVMKAAVGDLAAAGPAIALLYGVAWLLRTCPSGVVLCTSVRL